jgi:hypothetical protein
MEFESKAHMAQELITGKRFKNESGSIIYFDADEEIPFRCDEHPLTLLWGSFASDIWTEVKLRHVHQDLMDSYQDGQAWQYISDVGCLYRDCVSHGAWIEPDWDERNTYHLHPHNTLIQAYCNGAKIQVCSYDEWVDVLDPYWYEDVQYRIKPVTENRD